MSRIKGASLHTPPIAATTSGLERKIKGGVTFRVDGGDPLGLIDETLNKRRGGISTRYPAQYRVEAPSLALWLIRRTR